MDITITEILFTSQIIRCMKRIISVLCCAMHILIQTAHLRVEVVG